MTIDTQLENQYRFDLDTFDDIWVFGYGSLIYKVDFDYFESAYGYVHGFSRRFWQGSHDHRGTPKHPGRVLTLIPTPEETCFGRAFRVDKSVFEHLDHREKNGYLRELTTIELSDRTVEGIVYIANRDNAAFLGDAPIDEIGKQIAESRGPSGFNKDYVFQLADALRLHNQHDPHVFSVEAAVKSALPS